MVSVWFTLVIEELYLSLLLSWQDIELDNYRILAG